MHGCDWYSPPPNLHSRNGDRYMIPDKPASEHSPTLHYRRLARHAWGFIKCLFNPGKCKEVDRLLFQYVENELDAKTHNRLRAHIEACAVCQEYVESYRQVIMLAGQSGCHTQKLPPELERTLEQFIKTNPDLK